jgi:hypothetical protein
MLCNGRLKVSPVMSQAVESERPQATVYTFRIREATGALWYNKPRKAGSEFLTINTLASPHFYSLYQNNFTSSTHLSYLPTDMAIIDSFKANTTSVEVPVLRSIAHSGSLIISAVLLAR